jgi:hypothetical protein
MTEPTETGVIRLENSEEFVEHSAEILQNPVRSIYLLCNDFDKPWLGQETLVQALKKAVIKNPRVQVRILLADTRLAVKTHHPLLPLIRKLSRIEARVIQEEMLEKQPIKENFLLVDRDKLVVRQLQQDYIGFAHYDDKHSVQNFTEAFDQYWRFSNTDSDLRHVYV